MSASDTNSQYRYFYTDPLAAAWMAKHFGMRFHNANNGAEITEQAVMRHAATGNECRIHIRPDSLHLLEPLIGDRMQYKDHAPYVFNGGQNIGGILDPIIQRDGKPFHFPEREDIA